MPTFNPGDVVELAEDTYGDSPTGYGRTLLHKGDKYELTREYTTRATIRRLEPETYMTNSWNVPITSLVASTRPTPPLPLDQVPAGKISPTDPGLDWLWERAGEYAKQRGLCSDYDKFCDKFGIPGRERSISVSLDVNGIEIKASVKARSKAEAEQQVRNAFAPTASA